MWYAQWLVARAKTLAELEAAARILDWVAAAALPSGVLPEQLDPYSGAPISVSPLTWSHATVISLVQETCASAPSCWPRRRGAPGRGGSRRPADPGPAPLMSGEGLI